MVDLKLTDDGDLDINAAGDISIVDSIKQAIAVRLRWFLGEWRFAPEYGIPYYESILVKNPNTENVRAQIRSAIMSVDGITDVKNLTVTVQAQGRTAAINFTAYTDTDSFHEEVSIDV